MCYTDRQSVRLAGVSSLKEKEEMTTLRDFIVARREGQEMPKPKHLAMASVAGSAASLLSAKLIRYLIHVPPRRGPARKRWRSRRRLYRV